MESTAPDPRNSGSTKGGSRRAGRTTVRLVLAALLGAAVFTALFLFGRHHTPDYTRTLFGNSGTAAIALKAQLATGILALGLVQLGLAVALYRRLPRQRRVPRAVPRSHRLVGFVLFAATVPVAVHCVMAYGVQLGSARIAVHSVAGCFFYGAFVAKVVLVRSRRLPGWALPLAGGLLLTSVAVLWYSAALWYFDNYQLP
jgi:hypothetical protein